MAILSWSSIITALVILYFAFSIQKMYQMMNPLYGVQVSDEESTVDPAWKENQSFSMICYLSQKIRPVYELDKMSSEGLILWKNTELNFNYLQKELTINFQIELPNNKPLNDIQKSDNQVIYASRDIWSKIHSNQSALFLHVLATANTKYEGVQGKSLHGVVRLIKYDKIPKSFRHRYLLSDFGIVSISAEEATKANISADTIISYWKPEVAVRLVTDFSRYPLDLVPDALRQHVFEVKSRENVKGQKRGPNTGTRRLLYNPPIHVDEIGLTSDKYIPLNRSVTSLPLKLSYGSMSLERWLLMTHMEQSLNEQKTLGFTDKDVDDIRRLISDTSIYLLGITIVASLLHLLFEFLAFQSDVLFWRDNKSLAGLSTRTVISELFSQVIVFLFLLESDTSVLVTVPAFIGICIQAWKVRKATGLTIIPSSSSIFRYKIKFTRWEKISASTIEETDDSSKSNSTISNNLEKDITTDYKVTSTRSEGVTDEQIAKVTLEADRIATQYLGTLLLPLAIGLSVRSLIVDKHASWYSWGIGSLTGVVYTFGFVLMCPQLFINHKLKSVAYLPWKFMVYKFLNTFIDDLFAFIIKMPTMHRLSVFRDDIVFFIYLYQRWIYRVDTSRPIEK